MLLCTSRADPNARDNNSDTPLHGAVQLGRAEVIELWLANGTVDAECPDEYGHTPLHVAVRRDRTVAVQALLTSGRVNTDVITPSSLASNVNCRFEYVQKTVHLLVETGKVEAIAVLQYPSIRRHEPLLKFLLAFIESASPSPAWQLIPSQLLLPEVFNLIRNGNSITLKESISLHNLDIDARDEAGYTPLSFAASCGNAKIFKVLLDSKTRFNQLPLSLMAAISLAEGSEVRNLLIEAKQKHDARGREEEGNGGTDIIMTD